MSALLLAGLLTSAASAGAAPAVASSTSAVSALLAQSTQTIGSLYTGDRVRDPFQAASMGAGPVVRRGKDEAPLPVDIHLLQLRGIMKDSKADYALFASDTGGTLILRDGRLFDERSKLVPGITGKILLKQKTVQLVTAEKDVQIFRIGERDEEKDQEKKAP